MVRTQKRFERIEQKYEGHRERGKKLRGTKPRRAARHLLKAAGFAEQLAEMEETERVAEKRREVALNLRQAAQEELANESSEVSVVDPGPTNGDKEPDDREDDEATATQSTAESPGAEYFEAPPEIGFEDVGGMEDVIADLEEHVVHPLQHTELASEIGIGVNNGALLYGPPGTGKTYIARALAGELEYSFAEVKCSELGSKYVNEGAENVSALFEAARDRQPCVVFLDEIDSLAPDRTTGPSQTGSERKMVTELLQEMERIQGSDIVVLAATNLVEDVDVAIRRSGRFDRTFHVDVPGATARAEIFEVHLSELSVDWDDVDVDALVEATDDFTGADIAAAVEAAGRAALDDSIHAGQVQPITQGHLMDAIEEITPRTDEWEAKREERPTVPHQ